MTDWLVGVAAVLSTLVGAGDEDVECLRLGALDAVRVEAFTSGDGDRLTDVYATPEGAAADRTLLTDYTERGLRLRGGALERLVCRVTESREGRLELDVVDRLGPTWAVDSKGRLRELPRASARRRTVTLTETDDGWRVAGVE